MTTRFPHILLVTFCLLALATSASAECAWVLWNNLLMPDASVDWMPWDSFTSRAECDRALQVAWQGKEKRPGSEFSKRASFVCLPDTVDPRGPKGK